MATLVKDVHLACNTLLGHALRKRVDLRDRRRLVVRNAPHKGRGHLARNVRGGANVGQALIGRLAARHHRQIVVEQIAPRLATRLGHAQVDARVARLHIAHIGKVEQRIAQHHGVGTNILRTSPGKACEGSGLPLRCQRGADHAARRETHDAHALGIDMPLVGVGAHGSDHLGEVRLRVRKAHVARGARHIVEHKGLVAAVQKCKRHRVLLVRSDMRKPASAADDHRGAAAIGLVGQQLGTQIRKRRRIILGRLLAPQRMVLNNHRCSLRTIRAHSFFASKRTPLEPVAKKHSRNKFPFN